MKTARFLLACALVSVLAACGGGQGITAPDTTVPARPHFDLDPPTGGDDGASQDTGTGPTNCILIVVVNPDGTVKQQCQANANGQFGSGS